MLRTCSFNPGSVIPKNCPARLDMNRRATAGIGPAAIAKMQSTPRGSVSEGPKC